MIVLKLADLRLEGDIAAAFAFFNSNSKKKLAINDQGDHVSFYNIFLVRNLVGVLKSFIYSFVDLLLSHLQLSLHNTSLVQFDNDRSSILNGGQLHSTIQLVQFEFVTQSKRQITFNVEGISIKLVDPFAKSCPSTDNVMEQDFVMQMSFPLLFTYIIDDKFAIISIAALEVIACDMFQLLQSFTQRQSRTNDRDGGEMKAKQSKHLLERILAAVDRLIESNSINRIKFILKSCSLRLLKPSGNDLLTLTIKPIEVNLSRHEEEKKKLDCNIVMTNCLLEAATASEFVFALTKCMLQAKIEKSCDKLYLQVSLDIASNSIVISDLLANSLMQDFVNSTKLWRQKKQGATSLVLANVDDDENSLANILASSVAKVGFVVDINDVSFTLQQSNDITVTTTYGLKHFKIGCGQNFDLLSPETR